MLVYGPYEEDEDPPALDVTTESQIALNALLDATRGVCRDARCYANFKRWSLETLPVRGLASYLATGAPGVDEVAALINRIAVSAAWRISILRDAGYIYGEPADYDQLPHTVIEVG